MVINNNKNRYKLFLHFLTYKFDRISFKKDLITTITCSIHIRSEN